MTVALRSITSDPSPAYEYMFGVTILRAAAAAAAVRQNSFSDAAARQRPFYGPAVLRIAQKTPQPLNSFDITSFTSAQDRPGQMTADRMLTEAKRCALALIPSPMWSTILQRAAKFAGHATHKKPLISE